MSNFPLINDDGNLILSIQVSVISTVDTGHEDMIVSISGD